MDGEPRSRREHPRGNAQPKSRRLGLLLVGGALILGTLGWQVRLTTSVSPMDQMHRHTLDILKRLDALTAKVCMMLNRGL